MKATTKQLGAAAALTLAAAGLGYYSQMDTSSGGQRAGQLLARKGCDVTITSPAAAPGGRLALSAGQSLAVTLTGRALRCPAGTVTVTAVVNHGAPSTLGTATVSGTGAWTFGPTTLDDQAETVLTAGMTSTVNDASTSTSAALTIDANTARPRVVLSSPVPAGDGRIRIASPAADAGCGGGSNQHAAHGEPGWTHDLSCAAGGQVAPLVTVYGAAGGTLTATYGITPLATVPITSDPQVFAADGGLGLWTLDDWTRDDLVLRVAAAADAGVAELQYDLEVATGSPPEVVFTGRVLSERAANFDIEVTLPATVAPVQRPALEILLTDDTFAFGSAPSGGWDGGRPPIDWENKAILAARRVPCWGDGSDNGVQLWSCTDGKRYRGGENYVEHFLAQPPLQSYYFAVQVVW